MDQGVGSETITSSGGIAPGTAADAAGYDNRRKSRRTCTYCATPGCYECLDLCGTATQAQAALSEAKARKMPPGCCRAAPPWVDAGVRHRTGACGACDAWRGLCPPGAWRRAVACVAIGSAWSCGSLGRAAGCCVRRAWCRCGAARTCCGTLGSYRPPLRCCGLRRRDCSCGTSTPVGPSTPRGRGLSLESWSGSGGGGGLGLSLGAGTQLRLESPLLRAHTAGDRQALFPGSLERQQHASLGGSDGAGGGESVGITGTGMDMGGCCSAVGGCCAAMCCMGEYDEWGDSEDEDGGGAGALHAGAG